MKLNFRKLICLGSIFYMSALPLEAMSSPGDELTSVRFQSVTYPRDCIGGAGTKSKVGLWSCAANVERYDWNILETSSPTVFYIQNKENKVRCLMSMSNGNYLRYYKGNRGCKDHPLARWNIKSEDGSLLSASDIRNGIYGQRLRLINQGNRRCASEEGTGKGRVRACNNRDNQLFAIHVPGPISGTTIPNVPANIPDPELRRCINDNKLRELVTNDRDLRTLKCVGPGFPGAGFPGGGYWISSLEGIGNLVNLRTLSVGGNNISNLSHVGALFNLELLIVGNYSYTNVFNDADFDSIKHLSNLREIHLSVDPPRIDYNGSGFDSGFLGLREMTVYTSDAVSCSFRQVIDNYNPRLELSGDFFYGCRNR